MQFTSMKKSLALASLIALAVSGSVFAAPAAPTGLQVPSLSTTTDGTTLIWERPAKTKDIIAYNVYMDGKLIQRTDEDCFLFPFFGSPNSHLLHAFPFFSSFPQNATQMCHNACYDSFIISYILTKINVIKKLLIFPGKSRASAIACRRSMNHSFCFLAASVQAQIISSILLILRCISFANAIWQRVRTRLWSG